MNGESESNRQLYVDSRTALLDVLDQLGMHASSVVLVGAQAIYLRSEAAPMAIAPYTKDADLALIPPLGIDPALEDAMAAAGLSQRLNQPGIWERAGAQVDLLVPSALASPEGKRGARLEGHSPTAARKVVGLEGAAIDRDQMLIKGLASGDNRAMMSLVAGPAALLVAKVHKLLERSESPALNKDAHDAYRLLSATATDDLADRVQRIRRSQIAPEVVDRALTGLEELFGTATARGTMMAAAAETGIGNPAFVAASVSTLSQDLLRALDDRSG